MEKNWSVSLEHEEYVNNMELVVKDAIEAVEKTSKGFYVYVVTPANFGNSIDYLCNHWCLSPLVDTFHLVWTVPPK
jgi:hypothetical protein